MAPKSGSSHARAALVSGGPESAPKCGSSHARAAGGRWSGSGTSTNGCARPDDGQPQVARRCTDTSVWWSGNGLAMSEGARGRTATRWYLGAVVREWFLRGRSCQMTCSHEMIARCGGPVPNGGHSTSLARRHAGGPELVGMRSARPNHERAPNNALLGGQGESTTQKIRDHSWAGFNIDSQLLAVRLHILR